MIETAYDEGTIAIGHSHQPIRELELELRSGAAALYRLACDFHAAAPLMIETESKAARGYRLANQSAGLADDATGVHQMRIAIRRLRAPLVLFQPFLEPQATDLFQDELRRIGRVFGEARDWDVFCLQILPNVLESQHDAGWRDLLLAPARAAQAGAHASFAEEVRSPAVTRLVLGLAAWAEEIRLPDNPKSQRPNRRPVSRPARPSGGKGGAAWPTDPHRSETGLHALWKSLKKLRYGIDFLRPVFHPEPLKSYLHDCKKLQQTLGDINDTVTATALAERLVKGKRLDLAPAVGVLADQLCQRRNDALNHLAKRWDAFSDQPNFWA